MDRVSRTSNTTRGVEFHKELHKIKVTYAGMHDTKFFKGHSPMEDANTETCDESMYRMYIVDSGASLHIIGKVFLSVSHRRNEQPYDKPTNDHLEVQAATGIVRSTEEARVYVQELRARHDPAS